MFINDDRLNSVFIIIIGLVIGSFLNAVIHRLPRKQSISRGRSACPHCNQQIKWIHNIPVLSFLMLRGKCACCDGKISFRYPVVELLTSLLFFACYKAFGSGYWLLLKDWPFMALMIAAAFIDLEHRIIPDSLSLGGMIYGVLVSFFNFGLNWQGAVLGASIGFGIFYLLALVYFKSTGKMGLGGGDIKLLGMIGAFGGISAVFTTILVSSVIGSFCGIILAFVSRNKNWRQIAIPYGPFLAIGGIYYYLIGELIWLQFMIPT